MGRKWNYYSKSTFPTMTDYKAFPAPLLSADASLAGELNSLTLRPSAASKQKCLMQRLMDGTPSHYPLCAFKCVSTKSGSGGPQTMPLSTSAGIYNDIQPGPISIYTCFKKSIIIPVHKKTIPACLNDYYLLLPL